MLELLIYIIIGLIFGDILSFITHYLSNIFLQEERGKKRRENPFKEYFNFFLTQITDKNLRWKFITWYLLIDTVTVLTTVFLLYHFGHGIKGVAAVFFTYCLIALTFVDARTQILPDVITRPLIVIGLIQAYFGVFTDLRSAVIGALLGYFILWAINTGFLLIRKKHGMGYGDFKLLSAIGAWVGFTQLPLVILMSSIIGIFVAIIISRLPEKSIYHPTAFGPSLSVAGFVSLVWGVQIMDWYLGLYV